MKSRWAAPTHTADIETLTCLLARVALDGESGHRIAACLRRLPAQTIFLERCRQHGLAPLVYRNLRELGLENVLDGEAREGFRAAFYRTLADNLLLLNDLREITGEAALRGIPLLVLKGPALIHLVYGDPALRPMSDLDLLLRPDHMAGLTQVLRALDYAPVPLYPNLFHRGKTMVDLHTDPINRSRIESRGKIIRLDIPALWRDARPLPGIPHLQMLCPCDQVHTLAIHALKHGFGLGIWSVDIAECLDTLHTEDEWERLAGRCRASGTGGIFALTLDIVREQLQREVPPEALNVPDSSLRPLERRVLRLGAVPGLHAMLEPLALFRAAGGARGKITYLLEAAFPRPEVLSQISGLRGRWGFWLSYPYRLAQLFCMGVRCACRLGQYILHKHLGINAL